MHEIWAKGCLGDQNGRGKTAATFRLLSSTSISDGIRPSVHNPFLSNLFCTPSIHRRQTISMAHAAFPSLPPPPSSSSLAPAPCHPSQIRDLITSYTSLPDIQHLLIPLLQSVAEGNGQVGSKVSQKVKHGEEILGLHGVDVGSSTNEALGGMTAGMIYVV